MTLRITAASAGESLTIYAGSVTASTETRMLSGLAVKYGVTGRTSKGRLKVAPGALKFPEPLSRVKLTKEHDRGTSRGFLSSLEYVADGIRASATVADGPEGDDALREANPEKPIRDGFSFDVVDAIIQGDTIVSASVVAIGQVGVPAYDDTRIDTIAASQTPAQPTGETMKLTPEQIARLAALRAQSTRTAEEETELTTLAALETPPPAAAAAAPAAAPAAAAAPAPAPVAQAQTGLAAAPAGVPVAASHTEIRETGLNAFAALVAAAMHPTTRGSAEITAALADVTHAQHTANVSPESWTGELWSGLLYQPQFIDLFSAAPLLNYEGKGWRWDVTPAVGDYAGDKADIPTNVPTTVASTYEAFRIAGGWDIDRKFFDFPDSAFIASFLERARESYTKKLDFKVRDYLIAQAVAPAGVVSQTNLLKAAALAALHVKRNTDGSPATFILVNDLDMFTLFDINELEVSAFLDVLGVDPKNFRSTKDVAAGTVYAGAKQAATVRQLPGASPLRVEAQNLTKAGIDDAIFGYAAIEEHHTSGIVKVPFAIA